MHNLVHLTCTGCILIQNILIRANIMNPSTHYITIIIYTSLDTLFLHNNKRALSLYIHHIATLKLLHGAIFMHQFISCENTVLLEATTFFVSLNKQFKNDFTLIARNISWILVRVFALPLISVKALHELYMYDVSYFLEYGWSIVTLVVLSFEWTNEILKTDMRWISVMYYAIPLVFHANNKNYTSIYATLLICISRLTFQRLVLPNKYEYRLLFDSFNSYLLL